MTKFNQYFAENITFGIKTDNRRALIEAFSGVPREAFAGSPPYELISKMPGRAKSIQSDKLVDLYQDVLISLKPERNINIGLPSLWAFLLSELDISPGMTVFQSGSGSGYYTAILSKLVGVSGTVYFDEIDTSLREQSRVNLKNYENTKCQLPDVINFDRIVFFYGCCRIKSSLIERLSENGRICIPATDRSGRGRILIITRASTGFRFEIGIPVYFITDQNYPVESSGITLPSMKNWHLTHDEFLSKKSKDGWFEFAHLLPESEAV